MVFDIELNALAVLGSVLAPAFRRAGRTGGAISVARADAPVVFAEAGVHGAAANQNVRFRERFDAGVIVLKAEPCRPCWRGGPNVGYGALPVPSLVDPPGGGASPPVKIHCAIGVPATVKTAGLLSIPFGADELVKTASYSLPVMPSLAVKVRFPLGRTVYPPLPLVMLVKSLYPPVPLGVATCQDSVGVGLPPATEIKVTVDPAATVWLSGWVVIVGAVVTVSVAAVVVAVKGETLLVKTA